MKNTPILVTGAPRSGTTVTGKLLALAPGVGYVHEPFNRDYGEKRVDAWFPYTHEGLGNEPRYRAIFDDLVRGKAVYKRAPLIGERNAPHLVLGRLLLRNRHQLTYHIARLNPGVRRFLIKDPLACLLSEYAHRTSHFDVVVLIRHPAAFVASMTRMNWVFNFDDHLSNEALCRNHPLPPGFTPPASDAGPFEIAASAWYFLNAILTCFLDRNDKMIVLRHEDLSVDPEARMSDLYDRLGLSFSERCRRKIIQTTGGDNPIAPQEGRIHDLTRNSRANIKRWKDILSKDDIRCIRAITEPLACRYYSDIDW